MALAENIKAKRLENGMVQEELAEKLGVKRMAISQYEAGNRIPDIYKLEKMADIFGVTVDYLLKYDSKKGE